jgi:uncharacterized protein (TIGR01777 family)
VRVAILGASGFVGRALSAALRARGDDVEAVSLRDPASAAARAAACGAIVNVAGEPVAQRWTKTVKRRIMESRTTMPRDFLARIAPLSPRTTVYVSASAIGYYGPSDEALLDETSPAGSDFLAQVCVEWERVTVHAEALGMRTACIRTGIALGRGGALAKMLPIFRLGLGGRFGTGTQWYPWIHVDDLVGVYLLALDGARGAINAVAPNPVRNAEFAATLGRVLHRPARIRTPTFALQLALGEGANAVLEGQRAVPRRLQELGYEFAFPDLEGALTALLR